MVLLLNMFMFLCTVLFTSNFCGSLYKKGRAQGFKMKSGKEENERNLFLARAVGRKNFLKQW